jgi:FAD/FMN-containing dehydrogenase
MGLESIALEKGTPEYEESRKRFVNAAVPERYPSQIFEPRSTEDVAAIVKHASATGKHISIRSGGHLFPFQHLQQDEILIDMKKVNARFEYDEKTRLINFGPGQMVQEAQRWLTARKLFWPFGHAPTVGLGGFIIAGGQGFFNPGWGMTADRWVVQIEMVTADGEIRICNIRENPDLFWAARGGGMGFFAVVTKFWGRTTPAKTPYWMKWFFSGKDYEEALNWMLDSAKMMRPHHTEVMIRSAYADKDGATTDEIVSKDVEIWAQINLYADSLEEAQDMCIPFDECPLKPLRKLELRETNWDELNGTTVLLGGNRLKCDSILNDPEVPRKQVRLEIADIVCGCHPSDYARSSKSSFNRIYYSSRGDPSRQLGLFFTIGVLCCVICRV